MREMTKIKHNGHVWQGNNGKGTIDKNSENVDTFAYESDFCNGPRCIKCGYYFCQHCNPKGYDTKCSVGYYTCEKCAGIVDKEDIYCKHCGTKF